MDTLRHLAEKYFDGTISESEEVRLHHSLSVGEVSEHEFRQWEREWSAGGSTSGIALRGWHLFQEKVLAAPVAEISPALVMKRWHVAAAAAVVLVLIGLATVTGIRLGRPAEHFYSCQAPVGSQSQVVLPDGSKVWLNSGSEIRYSTLFNDGNRNVELLGEAYFEVAKHDGALFTVRTCGYDVVVKGTKFNVSAYTDDRTVTTLLMEGSVELRRDEVRMEMIPGETVILDRHTGRMSKFRDTQARVAWVAGEVTYDNIRLGDLARVLSRRYARNVVVKSESLAAQQFSVSLLNKEEISDVLKAINKITPIRVRHEGTTIYIE